MIRKKTYAKGGLATPYGQWQYPGQITTVPSNQITMQGVPYPVLGVSNTGKAKLMKPGMNYTFPGKSVTEYPMMQQGGPTQPPIYTNDSNDPRLRAYQDSLDAHNFGVDRRTEVHKGFRQAYPDEQKIHQYITPHFRSRYADKFEIKPEMEIGLAIPASMSKYLLESKTREERRRMEDELIYPVYKKPTQPYIYEPWQKPPDIHIDPLKSLDTGLLPTQQGSMPVPQTQSGFRQYKEEGNKFHQRGHNPHDRFQWSPITKETYRLGTEKKQYGGPIQPPKPYVVQENTQVNQKFAIDKPSIPFEPLTVAQQVALERQNQHKIGPAESERHYANQNLPKPAEDWTPDGSLKKLGSNALYWAGQADPGRVWDGINQQLPERYRSWHPEGNQMMRDAFSFAPIGTVSQARHITAAGKKALRTGKQLMQNDLPKAADRTMAKISDVIHSNRVTSPNVYKALANEVDMLPYHFSTSQRKAVKEGVEDGNRWLEDWFSHPETKKRFRDRAKALEEARPPGTGLYEGGRKASNAHIYGILSDPAQYKAILKHNPATQGKDRLLRYSPNEWDQMEKRFELGYHKSRAVGAGDRLRYAMDIPKEDTRNVLGVSHFSVVDANNRVFGARRARVAENLADLKKESALTGVHEGLHGVTQGDHLLKPFTKVFQAPFAKNAASINPKKGEYFIQPTEIYARIMEGRYAMGLQPGDRVTGSMLQRLSDSVDAPLSWDGFSSLVTDWDKLATLFNKVPSMALPVAGAAGVGAATYSGGSDKKPDMRRGGYLPKYQAGGYQIPIGRTDWSKTSRPQGTGFGSQLGSMSPGVYSGLGMLGAGIARAGASEEGSKWNSGLQGGLAMAGQGAALGSMFGPMGTAIGAGAGLIGGGIMGMVGYNKAEKARQEEEESLRAERQEEEQKLFADHSRSVLNTFNTHRLHSYYQKGGPINRNAFTQSEDPRIREALFIATPEGSKMAQAQWQFEDSGPVGNMRRAGELVGPAGIMQPHAGSSNDPIENIIRRYFNNPTKRDDGYDYLHYDLGIDGEDSQRGAQYKNKLDIERGMNPRNRQYGGNVGPTYEAEGEEVIEYGNNPPQVHGRGGLSSLGSGLAKIHGPSHEAGGVDMDGGDFIYSDTLQVPKELVKQLNLA